MYLSIVSLRSDPHQASLAFEPVTANPSSLTLA